jgi:hypothetical protein
MPATLHMRLLALLVFVFGLAAVPVIAQSTYGAITGTVTDSSGAAVPGATVTVTSLGTGEVHTAKSDAAGNYSVVNLMPAIYKVQVEKDKYKRYVRSSLELPVGATIRIDASLEVGAATETVEVTAQVALLQTDSGTMSTQVEGQTVTEMPLNGRNSMNLLALSAGVVPQGSTQGGTGMNQNNTNHTNNQGWNNYQIGGSLAGESSMYVDGAPNSTLGGNTVGLIMTQDAVQEFNVASNSMTADFGRNGGAVINMASKGGSNAIKGSAYEYIRNAAFNANEFWNKYDQVTGSQKNKPLPWNQNQYGLSLGGPIKKDKIFFQFNWEGFKATTSSSQPGLVPTANQMKGIIPNTHISDPGASATAGAFSTCVFNTTINPGNTTITNLGQPGCGDPLAAVTKNYYPSPTPGYSDVNNNNFLIQPAATDKQNQYNGRVDYVASNNQRIFGRYTYWKLNDTGQSLLGDANGWKTANAAAANTTHQVVLGDTYTFSASTVLDVRLSYLRNYSPGSIPESMGQDFSKFPGSSYLQNAAVVNAMSVKVLPLFGVGSHGPGAISYDNIGRAGMFAIDTYDTYSLSGSLIKIFGNHNLKIGGEGRFMDDSDLGGGNGNNGSGSFNFDGSFTGDAWTDFLLGYVKGGQGFGAGGQLGIYAASTSYNYYQAYYATDSWQATHKLTLTTGVRYELPGGLFERHDKNDVLLPNYQWTDPTTGARVLGSLALVNSTLPDGTSVPKSVIDIKHGLVAPRIGFAYRVGNDSAIRGGYGISYLAVDTATGPMPGHSPLNSTTSYCGSLTQVGHSYFPSASQLMYNCFGGSGATVVAPPARKYNAGGLNSGGTTIMNALGYLGNTTNSVQGAIPNQKYPYVQQWNLSGSHQFKNDLMLEVDYAGAKGTHSPGLGSNFNQLPDSYIAALHVTDPASQTAAENAVAATGTCGYNGSVGQCERPYSYYGNVSDQLNYTASTIYHSMQIKGEKRFHAGGTLMGNYTWAKTIGDTDSSLGSYLEVSSSSGPGSSSGGNIQDYDNMKAERSVLGFDVPQRAVITYIMTLPFGQGQKWGHDTNSIVNHLISGWAVNGITTFQHGFHVGLTASAPTSYTMSNYGTGSLRPNFQAGCSKIATGSRWQRAMVNKEWFNTSCFSTPYDFTYGNEARVDSNIFSQGIDNFDFSAVKETKVTERVSVQFRAEFFNLFNHEQFAPPVGSIGAQNAGHILQGANQPRLGQFALRMNF